MEHENVKVDPAESGGYLVSGLSFRFLKIEDNNKFNTLRAGVVKEQWGKIDYAKIDITIHDGFRGNLQNRTMEEYKERIAEIFVYLETEYGIQVNADDLKFDLMEINVTIPIKDEFYKYHRVLQLMMFNLPNSFKKNTAISAANKKKVRLETETYYRSNETTAMKIYDKSRQLLESIGYQTPENYMRIEIVLKKGQRVKEAFKTRSVDGIIDAMINDFYMKEFRRLFVRPYRKWQDENAVRLRKMIKSHKKASPRYWKSNLIRDCSNREQSDQIPVLLDVADLLIQVKALDEAGHYRRSEDGIMKACVKDDVFLQNDAEKIEEVFDLVYEAYDNCAVLE